MKKNITKEQQIYINRLLDARKNNKPSNKEMDKERMLQEQWDGRIARNGMSYLEIEQLNNTFNNFR